MGRYPDQIKPVLKQAFDIPGPVLIGVHVDYRDNYKLFEQVEERVVVDHNARDADVLQCDDLVACRREFVTTDAVRRVGVLPVDRLSIG